MDKQARETLKRLAEEATFGPWSVAEVAGNPYCVVSDRWDTVICNAHSVKGFVVQPDDNAAFIAAANPSVVLSLLAEVERLEDKQAELVQVLEDCMYQFSHRVGDEYSGNLKGWQDTQSLSTVLYLGETLVALGTWERHPNEGISRRQFFRKKE